MNRYPNCPILCTAWGLNYLQDYPVTVQGVIFMGTGTSPLPLTAALPFIKNGRETAENQLRSLISWHLVLLAKIS